MPKKKPSKQIPATETVHFRPGSWLGQMISSHADIWQLSRGAAAKRLVGLAICGLNENAYRDVEELRQLAAGSFENALQQVYVEVVQREKQGQTQDSENRRAVVRELLHRYQVMYGTIEEEEEPERAKVRRTNG